MYTKRNVLIFGENQECEDAILLLKKHFSNAHDRLQYIASSCYDELYKQIVDANPKLVVVLADGANGMECVYQTKKYDDDALVFWFSDDRNFGMQSHRLDCTYFAEKPLVAGKLSKAISYCQNMGITI